jgi:hypothetical protein
MAQEARPPWAGENYDWWQAMKQMNQSAYHCARVPAGLEHHMDDLFSAAWAHAPWTEPFQDIQGSLQPPPRLETKVSLPAGLRGAGGLLQTRWRSGVASGAGTLPALAAGWPGHLQDAVTSRPLRLCCR